MRTKLVFSIKRKKEEEGGRFGEGNERKIEREKAENKQGNELVGRKESFKLNLLCPSREIFSSKIILAFHLKRESVLFLSKSSLKCFPPCFHLRLSTKKTEFFDLTVKID